ncbi:MAG TPA: Do family serine endopeptidase [Methylomirabilota bacterium]|jgi:serine protease Do|nr:Do family serine endopeptidase [Methylomirabilota bacterium]
MNGTRVTSPRNYYLGAAALVAAGLVLGLGLSAGLDLPRPSRASDVALAAVSNSAPLPESPFVSVVDRALPAVVFIDVTKKVGGDGDGSDEFMRRFFGQPMPRQQRVPSSGSGFIIDDQGRILTNNHVVRDAESIKVTLNDGRTFKATTVGTDPATDVAVIKIEGSKLPVLPLGDSDRLRIGDWAIAIGNPLGDLRGSVTVGIVSAQGRSNLNIFGGTPDYQDFIQTDASINFGNSGGPLCNIRGEAIGINTAINTSGQGIGFAIPINLAKHVAEQLVAHGTVKRAMMGVTLANMTPEIAEGFGLGNQQGVIIQSIVEDSPAEKAGLKRNDVIVEMNGTPVTDRDKFRLKIADTPSGTKVRIGVLRDGKRVYADVVLTDKDDLIANNNLKVQGNPDTDEIGMSVRDMTPSERTELKLDAGVKVTDVADGSEAEDKDIQPGDVIEEVNRQSVKDAADFRAQVAKVRKAGKPVVLIVNRNGGTRFETLKLDK